MAYLLVAHDLATVRYLSHRLVVMYLGEIVEEGLSEEIFPNPLHPYTQALISAALPARPGRRRPGRLTRRHPVIHRAAARDAASSSLSGRLRPMSRREADPP